MLFVQIPISKCAPKCNFGKLENSTQFLGPTKYKNILHTIHVVHYAFGATHIFHVVQPLSRSGRALGIARASRSRRVSSCGMLSRRPLIPQRSQNGTQNDAKTRTPKRCQNSYDHISYFVKCENMQIQCEAHSIRRFCKVVARMGHSSKSNRKWCNTAKSMNNLVKLGLEKVM